MGFFDKIRDAIAGDDEPKNIKVVFSEPKLGMTLVAGPHGEVLITAVTSGGAAEKANVRVGDFIISVNGSGPPKYADFITVVSSIGRPLSLEFSRPGVGDENSNKLDSSTSKVGLGGRFWGGGGESRPFQRVQDAVKQRTAPPPQPPPMTEEEKMERREAALRAAESRTNNWNKQINKGRQATHLKEAKSEVRENQFEESSSVETRRMVAYAKQKEARLAENMGYNPYQARLMGNTAARAAIAGGTGGGGVPIPSSPPIGDSGSAPSTQRGGSRQDWGHGHVLRDESSPVEYEGSDGKLEVLAKEIGAEVEQALGVILAQDSTISLVAIQTMLKMLKNMTVKSSEDKFKRIRLANPNFHAKVGAVDGGLEVMNAAGFVLHTNEEAYLQYGSCNPVPLRLRVAMQKLVQAEAKLKGKDVKLTG